MPRRNAWRPAPPRSLATAVVAACLLAMNSPRPAGGGEPAIRVYAELSDKKIQVGERFVYRATVVIQGGSQAAELILPDFGGLTLVQNNGNSQQFSQMGGDIELRKSATVTLQASKEGTYTIPPARARTGQGEFSSDPAVIEVVKAPVENLPAPLRKGDVLPAVTNYTELNRQLNGRLFLLPSLSRDQTYEGQAVEIRFEVLTDLWPDADWPMKALRPELSGIPGKDFDLLEVNNIAWRNPQGKRWNPKFRTQSIDGRSFKSVEVLRAVCIPKKSGDLELGPYTITAILPLSERHSDPADLFSMMMDAGVEASLPSSPKIVHVKPIPTVGQPENFGNLIGDYALKATLDRQEMSEDDLVTLRLTVSGKGNIEAIGEPPLPALEEFKLFASEKKTDINGLDGDGTHGEAVFEYTLRPKRSGALTIPPMQWSAFDPWKEAYRPLSSVPVTVNVTPSNRSLTVVEPSSKPSSQGRQEPGVRKLGDDLAYIETRGLAGDGGGLPLNRDPWFLWLQALPLLGLAMAYGWKQRQLRFTRDEGLARRRVARVVAGRRLRKTSQLCRQGHSAEFHSELSGAIRGFFGDKFNKPAGGLLNDEIVEELRQRGLPEETAASAREILDRCDNARFAPGAEDSAAMRELLGDAERLIQEMAKRV